MGLTMIDLFCDSFERVPQRIVLDIDDTPDAVHGGQQLAPTSTIWQCPKKLCRCSMR